LSQISDRWRRSFCQRPDTCPLSTRTAAWSSVRRAALSSILIGTVAMVAEEFSSCQIWPSNPSHGLSRTPGTSAFITDKAARTSLMDALLRHCGSPQKTGSFKKFEDLHEADRCS